MRPVFKVGYQVEIHLVGGEKISGVVTGQPSEQYVTISEKKPKRDQTLEVCVNYDAISHVYLNAEEPKKHDPIGLKFNE